MSAAPECTLDKQSFFARRSARLLPASSFVILICFVVALLSVRWHSSFFFSLSFFLSFFLLCNNVRLGTHLLIMRVDVFSVFVNLYAYPVWPSRLDILFWRHVCRIHILDQHMVFTAAVVLLYFPVRTIGAAALLVIGSRGAILLFVAIFLVVVDGRITSAALEVVDHGHWLGIFDVLADGPPKCGILFSAKSRVANSGRRLDCGRASAQRHMAQREAEKYRQRGGICWNCSLDVCLSDSGSLPQRDGVGACRLHHGCVVGGPR